MKRLVVDASVVAMLYFTEDDSLAAERLLQTAEECRAPAHLMTEVANVIWKHHRHGMIDEFGAMDILSKAMNLPVITDSSESLLADALELAVRYDRTVYESLYLALSLKTQLPLITADKRLVNAMSRTPLARQVRWIGDVHPA
jgi:predicted nucleic acid-binding protein